MILIAGIPRTLVAQIPGAETLAVQATSASLPVPRLKASSAREEALTRPGLRQVEPSLDYASFRTERGLYRLFGADEKSKAPAAPSSGAPASTKVGVGSAFRPTSEPKKPSKRLWYALLVAQHSAAVFDAWSTRDAIQSGRADELNPLLRPFAHSNAIYAATQAGPGLLDYLGHRMMGSPKGWVRRLWWVPQLAGTAGSLWSGAHNLTVAPRGAPGLAP